MLIPSTGPLTVEEFLEDVRAPASFPDVFILGSLDHRVTFRDQQCRAINLAVALGDRLKGARVAVVGGGVAGCTAALAMAQRGAADVHVFELRHRAIDLQRTAHHRWVHPNVYDWPLPNWDDDDARLPVLSWRAQTASKLTAELSETFEAAVAARTVAFHPNAQNIDPHRYNNKWRLRWASARANRDESLHDIDILALAVGFGVEADCVSGNEYWKPDGLANPLPGVAIVSGVGDGALVDAIRILVEDFDHSALKMLGASDHLVGVRQRIHEIEFDMEQYPGPVELAEAYSRLPVPSDFVESLKLRPNVSVILNSERPEPITRQAAPLNRFLISVLMRRGVLQYRRGRLEKNGDWDRRSVHDGRYHLTLMAEGRGPESIEGDLLVVRHGPTSALATLWEALWNQVKAVSERRRDNPRLSDRSRHPLWSANDFPTPLNASAVRVPRPAELADGSVVADAGPGSPKGWRDISPQFLDGAAKGYVARDAEAYFDGQEPTWADIASGVVAERHIVDELFDAIRKERDGSRHWSVHTLIGPGGEGKTTVAMQVGARLSRLGHPWRVLWWEGEESELFPGPDAIQGLLKDHPGAGIVLVVDQAHLLRGKKLDRVLDPEVLSPATLQARRSLHLLLCADEVAWNSATRRRDRWTSSPHHRRVSPLRGLDSQDAHRLAASYRAADLLGALAEGSSLDDQAATLVALARDREESALLGALIEGRHGHSYETHVEGILRRLDDLTKVAGLPLLRCYLLVAAASAEAIPSLDGRVLSGALGASGTRLDLTLQGLHSEILRSGFGEALRVRVRHHAIAGSVLKLAEAVTTESLPELYGLLSEAAVLVPDFPNVRGVLAIVQLADHLRKRDAESRLVIAAAEGAVRGAPDDKFCRSKLAQVYREHGGPGGPEAAEETCRQFFSSRPLALTEDRPLIVEWAVACGEHPDLPDRAARSAWLGLLSFSDQAGGTASLGRVHLRHLTVVLTGIELLDPDLSDARLARAHGCALQAGRLIPGTLHLDKHQGRARAGGPFDPAELGSSLSEACSIAWNGTSSAFRDLAIFPRGGVLTFAALDEVVARLPRHQRHRTG